MRKLGLIMAAGIMASAASANAAVNWTYSVQVDTSTNTYSVFGTMGSTTESLGLANIAFSVTGSGGVTITSATSKLPQGNQVSSDQSSTQSTGFSTRSATVAAGVANFTAQQDTTNPNGYFVDAFGAPNVFFGVGKTSPLSANQDNSFVPGVVTQVSWLTPVLLGTGSYTGTTGTITASSLASQIGLLPANSPGQGGQFTLVNGTNVFPAASETNGSANVAAVPEPASLGVLALGGLALLARRRKA